MTNLPETVGYIVLAGAALLLLNEAWQFCRRLLRQAYYLLRYHSTRRL